MQLYVRRASHSLLSHSLLTFPDCAHDTWHIPCKRVERGSPENGLPSEKIEPGPSAACVGRLNIAY